MWPDVVAGCGHVVAECVATSGGKAKGLCWGVNVRQVTPSGEIGLGLGFGLGLGLGLKLAGLA